MNDLGYSQVAPRDAGTRSAPGPALPNRAYLPPPSSHAAPHPYTTPRPPTAAPAAPAAATPVPRATRPPVEPMHESMVASTVDVGIAYDYLADEAADGGVAYATSHGYHVDDPVYANVRAPAAVAADLAASHFYDASDEGHYNDLVGLGASVYHSTVEDLPLDHEYEDAGDVMAAAAALKVPGQAAWLFPSGRAAAHHAPLFPRSAGPTRRCPRVRRLMLPTAKALNLYS